MYCLHLYYTENFGENQISDKLACDIFLKKNIKFLKFVVFCSQPALFSFLENKKLPKTTPVFTKKKNKSDAGIFLYSIIKIIAIKAY